MRLGVLLCLAFLVGCNDGGGGSDGAGTGLDGGQPSNVASPQAREDQRRQQRELDDERLRQLEQSLSHAPDAVEPPPPPPPPPGPTPEPSSNPSSPVTPDPPANPIPPTPTPVPPMPPIQQGHHNLGDYV